MDSKRQTFKDHLYAQSTKTISYKLKISVMVDEGTG